jgi:cbb3-type cytochrome oxidase subunit 3
MNLMKEVMSGAHLTLWPIISLVIFFTCSLIMLWWLFRKGSDTIYEDLRQSVLEDQPQENS